MKTCQSLTKCTLRITYKCTRNTFSCTQVPTSNTLPFQKLVVGLSLMEELLQLANSCADHEQWHPVYPQKSHLALDCNLANRSLWLSHNFCYTTNITILTAVRHLPNCVRYWLQPCHMWHQVTGWWTGRHYFPSNCQESPIQRDSLTFQKTWILSNTGVKTSNLAPLLIPL